MSFLSNIVKIGSSLLGGGKSGGGSILGNLAKTAVLAFTTKKANDAVNRSNARAAPTSADSTAAATPSQPDPGVRLQVSPDASHKIPVVYGRAQLSGIVTDAVLSNSNQTLTVVFTLCERTGVRLSNGQASSVAVRRVFINDQRVVLKANGFTVDFTVDRDGNVDRSLDGICDIRCWSGGSGSAFNVPVGTASLASTVNAYSVVPNWTVNHAMSDLVFAVVRLTYNRDRGITSIPTVRFDLQNNMTLPGDVLQDYMTNTRYGAGIPIEEIFSA